MPSRKLDYPVFDADNHFYEPKEALTQFLPDHRKGVIDYIDVRGRTKIMVRNQVSDYIPNPTFEVVARPGAQEDYFRHGSGGKSYREVMGKPMKAIPAFRNPAARLEVLDALGLDYTLMFPTLASLVEERLKDDPDLILDIVHALNQWMYETWQFNYEDRIFSTPVINLGDRRPRPRGTRVVPGARCQDRPGPARAGARLSRHPLAWACPSSTRSGRPASRPASRCRCTPRTAATPSTSTTGSPATSSSHSRPPHSGWSRWASGPIEDTMAALVCHGALTRNPELRILSVENGASWVPYLFYQFKDVYSKMPDSFPEDPIRHSSAASTSRRSGRTTSRRWPICAASTGSSSAPTGRIRRAWPTRSTWSTTSSTTASTTRASERSWAATWSTCSRCRTRSSTSPTCLRSFSPDPFRPTASVLGSPARSQR